ncbi:hypothetical protein BH20ACT3_BH20ACT3_00150 [soil metagenome]
MLSRSVPDRVSVPALVAALLALTFVGALLVRADGDVSLLVRAAPPWTEEVGSRDSLTVQEADDAFDGQFFYRLGVSPWSTDETVEGVTFDLPALRNSRWGYGALAFAASGGNPDLVPWALVGLNVAAAAAVGAIGGGLARSSGRHAAWGLLLVLWPGFVYSLSLDTSELAASAFLLGGLLALRHRRWAIAALALTAGIITRDTTAVVPFGVAAAGLWLWWMERARHRTRSATANGPSPEVAATTSVLVKPSGAADRSDRLATSAETTVGGPARASAGGAVLVVVGAAPLAVFGAWQVLQRVRFDELPLTSSGDNNLSVPFGGLVEQLGALLPPTGGDEAFRLLSMLGLIALLGAAGWCWPSPSAPTGAGSTTTTHESASAPSATAVAERVAWLPAVAVVVVLNAYLWSGATAFMRATTEAGLLSILVVLGSRRHRLVLPLVGLGLATLWALTAIGQLTRIG